MISPGSFPGFLANISGFLDSNEIAVPKINPLASIPISASESLTDFNLIISLVRDSKSSISCKIGSTSLNKMPFSGKS